MIITFGFFANKRLTKGVFGTEEVFGTWDVFDIGAVFSTRGVFSIGKAFFSVFKEIIGRLNCHFFKGSSAPSFLYELSLTMAVIYQKEINVFFSTCKEPKSSIL